MSQLAKDVLIGFTLSLLLVAFIRVVEFCPILKQLGLSELFLNPSQWIDVAPLVILLGFAYATWKIQWDIPGLTQLSQFSLVELALVMIVVHMPIIMQRLNRST